MHLSLPPKQNFKLLKGKGCSYVALVTPRCLNILLSTGSGNRTEFEGLTGRYKLTGVTHSTLSHSSFKYKFIIR